MMRDIKNETEKFIGKAKEKAGKLMDDYELELKGKVQIIKANIEDKAEDVKEEVFHKANEIIDKIKEQKNKE